MRSELGSVLPLKSEIPIKLACLTSVLGWKAAGLSCGENFGTMSGDHVVDGGGGGAQGEDEADDDDDDVERAAGTANRLRTRSRNWMDENMNVDEAGK